MYEYENALELMLDDRIVKHMTAYGKTLKPKSKAAYKKLLIAYFEYIKVRYEEYEPSEPSKSEGG